MHKVRHSTAARLVAIFLVAAMYLGPAAAWAGKRKAEVVAPKVSILVFPLDRTAAKAPASLGKDMAESIRNSIANAKGYMAITFSDRLPSISRAVAEGSLRKTDVAGPFSGSKTVANRIANDVHTDLYLAGSIDDYKINTDGKSAEVAVSAELVDVTSGSVLKAIAVTGKSPEGKSGASDADLASLAAADAVAKVMAEVVPGTPAVEFEQSAQVEKKPVKESASVSNAPERKMVLVFPVDVASGVPTEAGPQMAQWLRSSLSLGAEYRAVEFSERLPSVARLLQEGTLKKSDVSGSFSEVGSSAAKIASQVGSDIYLTGSIDDCKVDTKAKTAEMSVTVQVCDSQSGKVIKTIATTGKTPAGTQTGSEKELALLAAGNAAANVAKEITPNAPTVALVSSDSTKSRPKMRKPSTWKMVLFGLAVTAGISALSGNNGGSSGNGDNGNPPPPPY